jgi:hypothetical protein
MQINAYLKKRIVQLICNPKSEAAKVQEGQLPTAKQLLDTLFE